MQFTLFTVAFLAGLVAAIPTPTSEDSVLPRVAEPAPAATTAQGSLCFDAGDCIFNGGGDCVRGPGDVILGHCAAKAGTPTKPSTPSATGGSVCFDSFDCAFFGGGGTCVTDKGSFLGHCVKK